MACLPGIEAGTAKVEAALVDDENGLPAGVSVDCAACCGIVRGQTPRHAACSAALHGITRTDILSAL